MNAWAHLPNAHHIDWVIESIRRNLGTWSTSFLDRTWFTAVRNDAVNAAYDEEWNQDRNLAWDAALDAAQDAIWEAALVENIGTYWGSAWDSSTDAILALIAYDDCDQYLSMSYEMLLAYATLSERPQAVLLLPLKWMREREAIEA